MPRRTQSNERFYIKHAQVQVERIPSRIMTLQSTVSKGKEYKQFNTLSANSIDFGVRVADSTMMVMQTSTKPNGIKVMLNMWKKELQVTFPLIIDHKEQHYRFKLRISLLGRIHETKGASASERVLVIPFGSPPEFLKKEDDFGKTCKPRDRMWHEWAAWFRETDIVDKSTRQLMKLHPVTSRKDSAIIDIGEWTTYRISFDAKSLAGTQFQEFRETLADHGVVIAEHSHYTFQPPRPDPLPELLEDELSFTHPHLAPSSHSSLNELEKIAVSLPFVVRHQLEVCLSYGYLVRYNITLDFLRHLAAMQPDDAIWLLEHVAEKQLIYYDPMKIFDLRLKGKQTKNIPSYCLLSRSANITPSMVYINTPGIETSNRIMRKYRADADRFLRIKFSDEKVQGRISYQEGGRSDAAFDRVEQAMKMGIVVCGRYYEFLAYGNSQFRENGAYFYAPTASFSAERIRHLMGDFRHIKTVAKYAARHGQCFSSTRAVQVRVTIKEISTLR